MALKHLSLLNLASVLLLGGAIVGFTASAALAGGGGATMGPSGQMLSGKLQFRQYCAQCHGMDATGDGPVAAALKKKPANLTTLAKKNGGVFPEQEVREFIDGTKTAASHGTREMPIWGFAFMNRQSTMGGQNTASPLSEQEVKQKINRLVDYIKTIQVQ
jgi:mono/diheme cytochrome c family protein